MKKLSLLLFATCVALMSWTQNNSTAGLEYTLNPYAYDLSIKSWDPATRMLTVQFKLNAPPNLDDNGTENTGPYNTGIADNEPNGVQIYAVDKQGEEYRIGGLGRNVIQNGISNGYFEYTMDLSAGTSVEFKGTAKPLPLDEPLTWKVRVKGRSNKTAAYQKPRHITARPSGHKRPRYTLGVDVGNKPLSPNFGKIFITEVSDGSSLQGHATWGWLYDALYDANYTVDGGNHKRMPAILEYTPQLLYKTLHKKYKHDGVDSWFSGTLYYEPHRVRVSDDGRIFVTSHHTNAGAAVMEYKGNNQFLTIIDFDRTNVVTGTNAKFNRRVVSMDVKGSGSDLKILVAWIDADAATQNGKKCAQIQCWEYPIGTSESKHDHDSGTQIAEFNDLTYTSGSGVNDGTGLLYRGYLNSWNGGNLGFVDVAYGKGNNNPVWLKIDYSYGTVAPGQLLYFENGALKCTNTMNSGYHYNSYYGGNSLLIKGDTLITTGGQRLQLYKIGPNGQLSELDYITSTEFGAWTNGLALDYANNLYGVSEYTGRLITVALPYSGVVETPAPTNSTFTIAKPVPNILATDLTYAPYGNENKYEFSFNVNTKPELAQIRFYANEADMLANNDNYSFYYEFSEAERKQGRMSVIFDAVGGTIGYDKLLNDPNENGLRNLPRGEFYWNVYVKTRKSCAFAPIYTQPAVGANDFHRQHATVDNNPNNRGFGHIYVADHHNIAESNNRVHYVRAYTIGDATGNAKLDNQNNINDNTRYTTCWQVKSNNKVRYTRRPVVSPDGMVYIADEGANQKTVQPTWFKDPNISTYGFVGAGLHVLDPNKQTNNDTAVWEANFSVPHSTTKNQEVTTGAYFLYKDGGWKLYRTNTYDEFTLHPAEDGVNYNYQNSKWNTNGYRVYNLTSNVHSGYEDNSTTKVPFGAGDANGQFSIVATKNGVWMCQHRANSVANASITDKGNKQLPDNEENILLSFFDHSGARKFTSLTYDGGSLTQNETSPFQSAPGAGMAYQERGGKEYLYVVNHDGHILEFEITNGATTPSLTLTQKYPLGTGNKGAHGAVSSMNFDYAGNLVVTAGRTYGTSAKLQVGDPNVEVARDHQDLVIYTMPYPNQENARAIPASEAFRFLPERVAHLDMGAAELDLIIKGHEGQGCAIDLYRPLQGGEFNTICLPFTLNLTALPEGHPLKNATLKQYTGLNLSTVGGEKVLELVFTDVEPKSIAANQPYIIQPQKDIPHIISFDGPLVLTSTMGGTIENAVDGYSITHQGIVPFQYVEPEKDPNTGEILTLMLVADNRLAAMARGGNMLGFRGYFQLNQPLPKGMQTRITTQKPVATNTSIVVDGKRVNVEKFLREGRVCVRVGDTLYNINGEVIGR